MSHIGAFQPYSEKQHEEVKISADYPHLSLKHKRDYIIPYNYFIVLWHLLTGNMYGAYSRHSLKGTDQHRLLCRR